MSAFVTKTDQIPCFLVDLSGSKGRQFFWNCKKKTVLIDCFGNKTEGNNKNYYSQQFLTRYANKKR